jgi:hypothetical protein
MSLSLLSLIGGTNAEIVSARAFLASFKIQCKEVVGSFWRGEASLSTWMLIAIKDFATLKAFKGILEFARVSNNNHASTPCNLLRIPG